MPIGELIRDIRGTGAFTDVHQELALRWLAELGRPDAGERVGPARPDELQKRFQQLAHAAARYGRPDVLTAMAGSPMEAIRASLGAPNHRGSTPWHMAAKYSHEDAFIALIAQPEVLNGLTAGDQRGRTALEVAAQHGLERAIAAVANHPDERVRAALAATNNRGVTLAHRAAHAGRVGVINALAGCTHEDVQASLGGTDRHGRTALHVAAEQGHEDAFIALIAHRDAQAGLTMRDVRGGTPVLLAAALGLERAITAVATHPEEGVRASLAPGGLGTTPAHAAAVEGRVGVINALARSPYEEVRATLEAPNRDGVTPLWAAVSVGQEEVFMALLNSAARSGLVTVGPQGRSPLHAAARMGFERAISAVASDPDGRFRAGLAGRDGFGDTPAHHAAFGGHGNVIAVLALSPDPDVRASLQALNDQGKKPADIASERGDERVAEMLRPVNLALLRAAADLGKEKGSDAANLLSDLECPVSMKAYTVAGPDRPVRLLLLGPDGGVGTPSKQCLSATTAESLGIPHGALHPLDPFSRQPFEGYAEAPDRVQLLNEVAQAYGRNPNDPARAREQALHAYAAQQATPAAPDAALPPAGAVSIHYEAVLRAPVAGEDAAPSHYLGVLAGHGAAPGGSPVAGAGGPQPG